MPTMHKNVVTSHVDAESLPWVPFAPYSDEVLLKYHKVDPVRARSSPASACRPAPTWRPITTPER